jgi:hypothetical protein
MHTFAVAQLDQILLTVYDRQEAVPHLSVSTVRCASPEKRS